jgi:hypothetical protein
MKRNGSLKSIPSYCNKRLKTWSEPTKTSLPANLKSWLTLQLRYIVFQGAAKLVLKGNSGIEANRIDDETTIDQLATMGFTANLSHSVA